MTIIILAEFIRYYTTKDFLIPPKTSWFSAVINKVFAAFGVEKNGFYKHHFQFCSYQTLINLFRDDKKRLQVLLLSQYWFHTVLYDIVDKI